MNKLLKVAPEDVDSAAQLPVPPPSDPPPGDQLVSVASSSSKPQPSGFVGEGDNPEPVDGVNKHDNPASSSSKEIDGGSKDAQEEHSTNLDITSTFVPPGGLDIVTVEHISVKDRFLNCAFAMPGIALKKLAMCSSRDDCDIASYVGTFGVGSIKVYKKERSTMKGFMMGNFSKDPDLYWQLANKHLKGRKCGGFCIFDVCAIPVKQGRIHTLPY